MSDEIDLNTGRVSAPYQTARPVARLRRETRPTPTIPSIVSIIAIVMCTVIVVVSYEKLVPAPWKISTFIASFEQTMTEGTKTGELQAQAKYEPVILQMKAVNDQNVEHAKVAMQIVAANCQATYDRAKIYAQAAGSYRMAMVSAHLAQVRSEQAGEVGVISVARGLALTGNLITPGMGEGLYERVKPEQERLSQELDEAGRLGLAAEIDGWDEGIMAPEQCLETLNALEFMPMPDMPVITPSYAQGGR